MSAQLPQIWREGVKGAPTAPLAQIPADGDRIRYLVRCYQAYGPIFRLPGPGKPLTVLAGLDANVFAAGPGEQFLGTRAHWAAFDEAIGGTKMGAARDGDANRRRRAATARSYAGIHIQDQLPRLAAIIREFANGKTGEQVPVLPLMRRIVAEQLGRLLVGSGPGDYLPDLVLYLNTIVSATMRADGTGAAALATPEFEHARKRVDALAQEILAAKRAKPAPDQAPDLLDETLADAALHPELYAERDLMAAAIGPFLAGIDTVASTCSFLPYALLKDPGLMERVQTEADRIFAGGLPARDRLSAARTLHRAVLETLRLFPVAVGHQAQVLRPLTFAGYRLEPDDPVLVAMTVFHFLPEVFPNPDRFDVDRYEAPRNEHRRPGAFAPFGLGAHSCLGAGIAEIQLMTIPATLLHDLRLALPSPSYDLEVVEQPTRAPASSFYLTVLERRRQTEDRL